MKHIGMDLHSTTTDFTVRNSEGVIVKRKQVRSTRTDLVKFISSIPGSKRVMVEESQMADWVARALIPHVDEFIRCQPQYNDLISKSEDKYDRQDADSLSKLLYLNEFKGVHHPEWIFHQLREGVRAYWYASYEVTRAKNRLKAFFLFNGIHCVGPSVFSKRGRESFYQKLKECSGDVELARILFKRLDQNREMRAMHVKLLGELAKPVETEVRCLKSIPGIGIIGAYTLVALLERGKRFRNKRRLWKYCGLAIRRHESRGIGTQGASHLGNRHAKRVLMIAVASLVKCKRDKNALTKLWYQGRDRQINPKRLRRNVARKIAVLAQQLLRSKEMYDDARLMTKS
jgi:transposase